MIRDETFISLCEVVLCSTRDVVVHASKNIHLFRVFLFQEGLVLSVYMRITKTGIFFFSLKAACCKKKCFVCT